MKKITRLLGLLTFLLIFIGIVVSIYKIKTEVIDPWTYYNVEFDDIGNLKLDNSVKINGFAVGYVTNITRKNNKAFITIKIDNTINLHSDYKISCFDENLMGDRYLILNIGKSNDIISNTTVLSGEFIPGIAEGIKMADSLKGILDNLMIKVKDFASTDTSNKESFVNKFGTIVKDVDRLLVTVDTLVRGQESKYNKIVDDALALSDKFNKKTIELIPTIQNGLNTTDTLTLMLMEVLAKTEPIVLSTNTYLQEVIEGQNTLGRVVNDDDLVKKLIEANLKIQSGMQKLREEGAKMRIWFW